MCCRLLRGGNCVLIGFLWSRAWVRYGLQKPEDASPATVS
jgi:hypothetical protein